MAKRLAEGFDEKIDRVAFRLELRNDAQGREEMHWHVRVDGKPEVFDVDPYPGFWKRFGVDLTKIIRSNPRFKLSVSTTPIPLK